MAKFLDGLTEFLIKCGFCGHTFNAVNGAVFQDDFVKCPQCKHILDRYGVDHGKEISKDILPPTYDKNFITRII